MLSDKSKIAEKYNTEIIFKGTIYENEIDNIDLCIIFGNVIDNAIETCQQFRLDIKKEINIIIKHLNNFIMLTITNPVMSQIPIKNNTIYSTKDDTINYGFGIKSIKKIIEKYSGELEMVSENNIFTIKIYLSIT